MHYRQSSIVWNTAQLRKFALNYECNICGQILPFWIENSNQNSELDSHSYVNWIKTASSSIKLRNREQTKDNQSQTSHKPLVASYKRAEPRALIKLVAESVILNWNKSFSCTPWRRMRELSYLTPLITKLGGLFTPCCKMPLVSFIGYWVGLWPFLCAWRGRKLLARKWELNHDFSGVRPTG